jgi:protein TonB
MDNSRRLTTIAGVAAIHGLLGYVFISGMAASFVHKVVDPFTVTNIPIETPPPPPTPKPPTLDKVTPQQTTVAPPATVVTPIVPTHTVDPATCRLYQRRARFTPARDDGGNPVAGTFTDRVRWQLPM